MTTLPARLVDIVRDFLAVHHRTREVIERYRAGELRFEEIQSLFADGEESVLFRLKERCHALFRPRPGSDRLVTHREALFDLVVGSLFHEAMKFRENFYQREVYGPRVRALRSEAGEEADALFREFEKILEAGSDRLEEGLQETEALLEQTREQLVVLLVEHNRNGHVARTLVESADLVDEVFRDGLDALLTAVYGSPDCGYELVGRSYLASGYFDDAGRAFEEALERGGNGAPLDRLAAYARGMSAYLSADYVASVKWLAQWIDGEGAEDVELQDLVRVVMSSVDQLVLGPERDAVVAGAARLLERLGPAPAPPDQAGTGSARRWK